MRETLTLDLMVAGHAVPTPCDRVGAGADVLLLPALSTIASRTEMTGLGMRLAPDHRCLIPDWPGFGAHPRARLPLNPGTLHAYLDALLAAAPGPYVIRVQGSVAVEPFGSEIAVASDKTLIGVGTSGEIVHGELHLAPGTHNVVIRNLTIRDSYVEGLRRCGHRRVLPLAGPAELAGLVREEARAGDLVVLLGAGDITSWAYALPEQLQALGEAAE